MTEEEILEMGAKPKRTRAKALTREELEAMFAKHDEEILKKVSDKCETCSHHECECPQRLDEAKERMDRIDRNTVDIYNTLNAGIEDSENRMDKLDENDELLRQNLNRSHQELSAKLEEEHRLRVVSEERIEAMNQEMECLKVDNADILYALEESRKENTTFSKQNLYLGIMAGICLGVCLVVMAIFLVS